METEKLTVNHIAPYLPYGLKGKYTLSEVTILANGQKDEVREKTLDIENPLFFLKYCTPLLLPLSMCESRLNVDGEIEIDSSTLLYNKTCNSINIYPNGSEWTHSIDVYNNIYVYLFKHHFDVFGLIEKGLAIDKLTYK